MIQFLSARGDILTFVSLFACAVCAAQCIVLNREDGSSRRWMSFFSFYLFQGVFLVRHLLEPVFPFVELRHVVGVLAMSLSYGSLFAFSPWPPWQTRARLFLVGADLVAVLCLAAAVPLIGETRSLAAGAALLGAPGFVLAVTFLLSDPSVRRGRRVWLTAHVASLSLLGITSVAALLSAWILPGLLDVPFSALSSLLFLVAAVTLALHAVRSFTLLNRGFGRPFTRSAIFGSFASLPLVLLLGLLLAGVLGSRAEQEVRDDYAADLSSIERTMASEMRESDQGAFLLASSPTVEAYLSGSGSRSSFDAILERYRRILGVECFILDLDGAVLAATDRGLESLVDSSRDSRSWFVDAVTAGGGRTFAADPAHLPSYFSSAPVWGTGSILGVAVVVKRIADVFPHVSEGQLAFLVDPSAVILHSNDPRYAGRLMWTVGGAEQRSALASHYFGLVDFRPVLGAVQADGALVPWDDGLFMASRTLLSVPGWMVVHLGPAAQVHRYRIAGLLVAFVFTLVISMYSVGGQVSLLDEARVERSESMYRAVVEGSPNWVSIIDAKGRFTFTNSAGLRALQVDPSAGRTLESILGPARLREIAGQVDLAAREGIAAFEAVLPAAAGSDMTWKLTLVPLSKDGDRGALLIANDITATRQAEARLVRAERLAAVGTLAAGVAHQFNNINTVALFNAKVLESGRADPESAARALRALVGAIQRSVDITSRMLPLTVLPDSPGRRPTLGDAVRAVLMATQADFQREGARVELALEDACPVMMPASQLEFLVNALLSNALHAVLGRAERVVRVRTSTADGQGTLTVEDTGIGIPPDKIGNLFTPFFTEKGEHAPSSSVQAGVRGVGLSLSVTSSIVTGAGGDIDVTSEPGRGTTFTVRLPCEKDGGVAPG